MNELDQAVSYHKQAAEVFGGSGHREMQAQSILHLAADYEQLRQARAVITCLQQAAKIFRQIGENERAAELEDSVISMKDMPRRRRLPGRGSEKSLVMFGTLLRTTGAACA
jgi:hypothetical protein